MWAYIYVCVCVWIKIQPITFSRTLRKSKNPQTHTYRNINIHTSPKALRKEKKKSLNQEMGKIESYEP